MEGQKLTVIKKIKKGGGAGHHGGSWKVAFADFMTAMMAFFLLMWLLSMGPQKKKEDLANYFKTFSLFGDGGVAATSTVSMSEGTAGQPQTVPGQPPKATGDEGEEESEEEVEMRAMKAKIEQDIRAKLTNVKDQVVIDTFEGGIKVDIMDKAGQPMFHLGSTELTDTAKQVLGVVAADIKNSPRRIEIEGHTDAVAFSSQQRFGNWELSTARASAARVALEEYGLSSSLLVRVSGYADTEPIIKDDPFDPRNRRISLRILYPKDQAMASPQGETPGDKTPAHDGGAQVPTPPQTSTGQEPPLVAPPAPPDIAPHLVK